MLKRILPVSAWFLIATPVVAGNRETGAQALNPQELAVKYFDQMDINEDGVVTKDEFTASPFSKILKTFDVLQPNKEGVVEKEAFIEIFVKMNSKPATEA